MVGLEDELGDIIAKARVGVGLSVEQLAATAGFTPGEIMEIEAYRLKPDSQRLRKLAEALSLDAGKLAEIATETWTPSQINLANLNVILAAIAVPYGSYGENSYILGCPRDRAAAIVDPGGAVEEIACRIDDLKLTPELILITHAHSDHIGGLREIAAHWPEVRLVNHQLERDSASRGIRLRWEPAKDNISIQLGSLTITPLATPGHTPGSVCYSVDDVCFVGDTLFAGSIGYPGQRDAYKQMLSSIRQKVLSLPDGTALLPGHGPPTTVAEEKAHNPFFSNFG